MNSPIYAPLPKARRSRGASSGRGKPRRQRQGGSRERGAAGRNENKRLGQEGQVAPLVRPASFLRESAWNWLDGLVVLTGWIEIIAGDSLKQLSVLRVARLMRPLRTISAVPAMKTLVGTLMDPSTISKLANVVLLILLSTTPPPRPLPAQTTPHTDHIHAQSDTPPRARLPALAPAWSLPLDLPTAPGLPGPALPR
jgi:hypothetical protein